MPVFTKESHNHFDVDHFEVDNSFGFRFTVDGDYFAFAGMSLGDLVTINQHIAEAIRRGRRHALPDVVQMALNDDGEVTA